MPPLALNEIRRRVAAFAVEWADETSERGESQSFWNDLLDCFGVKRRQQGVLFERRARRASTGAHGFIDVFWPGVVLAEQKSGGKIVAPQGAGRSNAEDQAFDYLNGGDITPAEFPRYVVTSDFATIQVTDLEAPPGEPARTVTFATADLAANFRCLLFLAGYEQLDFVEAAQAEASVEAARLMAALYTALTGDADSDPSVNPDDEAVITHDASVLMMRLLFLMFADDAGLWDEPGVFERFIRNRTAEDGSDLGARLGDLFQWLDRPPHKRPDRADEALQGFPYVNGALFKERVDNAYFDQTMREALVRACEFDWTRISPAVFGSMFQAIKSKEARRQGGEHYTTEENILKVLRPMFLDELRAELDAANTRPKLNKLHERLATLRYLDPACGCGNFLIVAYRELRQLELDLLVKLREKQGRSQILSLDATYDLKVSLDQFHGIELNWWPAKIAETAMWLVDHQANLRMDATLGLAPKRLPINISARIVHANALTIDWSDVVRTNKDSRVYVFGNPPFVGARRKEGTQAAELESAWGHKVSGELDYVTAWHGQTLQYLRHRVGEWGFVTTNSITQGEPVAELFQPIWVAGWQIKFAHRTFKWTTEARSKDGAAVHCVIIGFARDPAERHLYDYPTLTGSPTLVPATNINAYLVDGPDVVVTSRPGKPLSPGLPRVHYGSMANDGGNLILDEVSVESARADPIAGKYVRRFVQAKDLVNNKPLRWCLWLAGADPRDINQSPFLTARVAATKEHRLKSNRSVTNKLAATPQLFAEIRQPTDRYVAIPRHTAEDRPYVTLLYLEPDIICGDANFAAVDPDGLIFSIMSSAMFITWQRTVGGRIKSDPRFSAEVVWNNFPMPDVDVKTRNKILTAGQAVLTARQRFPDRSLAEHYAPLSMDPDLVRAHRQLDRAVDVAFGLKKLHPQEIDRQSCLLRRYAELTTALVPPSDATPRRRRTSRRV